MKQFIYFIKNCFKYRSMLSKEDVHIEDCLVFSLNETKQKLQNFLRDYPDDKEIKKIICRVNRCLGMIDRIKTTSYMNMYFYRLFEHRHFVLSRSKAEFLLETAEKRDKAYLMKQLSKIYSAGYMI